MKMNKKIMSRMLLCLLCLSLAACKKQEKFQLVEVGNPDALLSSSSLELDQRRVTEIIETDYGCRYEKDSQLKRGEERREPGKKGRSEITYLVSFQDGQEISRQPISERIISKAVDEIIYIGTAEKGKNSPSSSHRKKGPLTKREEASQPNPANPTEEGSSSSVSSSSSEANSSSSLSSLPAPSSSTPLPPGSTDEPPIKSQTTSSSLPTGSSQATGWEGEVTENPPEEEASEEKSGQ